MDTAGGPRLRVGESLRRQSLTSANDAFTLNHYGFDDLMLLRNHDREPLWWSSPVGPADWTHRRTRSDHGVSDITLQPDGNLVAHDQSGTLLWSTGTADSGAELLEVRDDGDVVLLDGAGQVVWNTGTANTEVKPGPYAVARGDRMLVGQSLADQSLTSPNGRYVLVHGRQYRGTFMYGPDGLVTSWFYLVPVGYPHPYSTRLVLQEDGLFLVFSNGVRKAWDSLTTPRFPFRPKQLVVRDSGDLEMLDADGEVMWRNGYKCQAPSLAHAASRPFAHLRPQRVPHCSMPPTGTSNLPPVPVVPLVRTDFSDDAAWADTCAQITSPRHLSSGSFCANVEPISDPVYEGLAAAQLVQLVPQDVPWELLLVADRTTMTSLERHVMVVDLDDEYRGRTFRATPPAVQEIENNLSLANMDWEDFADCADDDGIVRPLLI